MAEGAEGGEGVGQCLQTLGQRMAMTHSVAESPIQKDGRAMNGGYGTSGLSGDNNGHQKT